MACALALAGCGDHPSGGASTRTGGPSAAALPPLPALPPGLTLRLTPHPDTNTLDVEIHLVGPSADHTNELTIARAWAGIDGFSALRGVAVRDEIGEIGTRQTHSEVEGPDRVLTLERAPERGHLVVRYRATSAAEDAPRFAMHFDRERLSGVGHTFLLLPRFDAALPTRIELRPGALAPGASGASSFGVGDDVETTATPDELAHAVYLAGRTRVLDGAAANASDRVVLLGRPMFDADLVQAKLARAKAGITKVFPGTIKVDAEGFSALVIAEPGFGKGHDGALLGRSLALWVGEARPFDAALMIAATHELGHRVIGQTVRLVSDRGEEQVWFTEGFTVHYARKIAFAEGLIGPADFAEDLERTLSRTASPALPGHARSREAYQRGALYAAMLDAALQKSSRGARSLDDVMRELTTQAAAEKKVDLPIEALRGLVTRELGPARGEELDWVMVKGHGEITLADDAFGPCFDRTKKKNKVFDLGFDAACLRESPAIIRGLVARSAAARAGLEEGMLVISSKVPASLEIDEKKPVEIVVSGRRGNKKIRYVPVGEREEIRWSKKGSCKRR